MVVPYQLYMMQRLCDDYLLPAREVLGDTELASFLRECGDTCAPGASGTGGATGSGANAEGVGGSSSSGVRAPSLMQLPQLMSGCRVEKRGGHLYWAADAAGATRSNL